MARKKNIFSEDLQPFLETCSSLRHICFFAESQLCKAREGIDKTLKVFEKKWGKEKYFVGTSLSIVDLFSSEEYIRRSPSAKTVIVGDNVLRLAIEVLRRINASVFVDLHESLERLLIVFYGKMWYQLRNDLVMNNKSAFHRWRARGDKHQGTSGYYQEYARYACRNNCKKALSDFQKHLDWERVTIDLWCRMSFAEVIFAIGTCRHSIVHNGGKVDKREWSKLDTNQVRFVESIMQEGVISGEKSILPDSKTVEECIEVMASFAYALYVLLSERCGMKLDYVPGNKT